MEFKVGIHVFLVLSGIYTVMVEVPSEHDGVSF